MMKNLRKKPKIINFNIWWAGYFIFGMAISSLSLMLTYVLEIFSKIAIGKEYDLISKGIAGVIFFVLVGIVLRYLYLLFRREAIYRWNYYLKTNLMKNILSRSAVDFKEKDRAYYVSIFNNDISFLQNNYIFPLSSIVEEAFVFAVALIYSLSINVIFTCLILLAGILSAVFTIKMSELSSKDNKTYMDKMGEYNETIDDGLRGFMLLYKFNAALRFIKLFEGRTAETERAHVKAEFMKSMMNSMANHVSCIVQMVLMFISTILIIQGQMDAVYFPVMVSLMNTLIYPMYTVTSELGQIKSCKAVLQNMRQELSIASEDISCDEMTDIQPELEIRNLDFSYGEKKIFKGINLKLSGNIHVLLRGNSGTGKSTLLKLLTREVLPERGDILLGGRRITEMSRGELFRHVSVIAQHPMIFRDTILQNIVLFEDKDNIDMGKVKRAVREAGLEDFIGRLENGLETVLIDSGDNLSGGEKQRIEVARAIYRDTPIILIDEATSGLDLGKAEELENIFRKMDKLVISTSHRRDIDLSKLYDRTVVIQDQNLVCEISGMG